MVLEHIKCKVAAVQAAPILLDLDGCVEKVINLIVEAASNEARLIAFPEVFIPGYPFWTLLENVGGSMKYAQKYFDNAMTATGPEMQRIQAAARDNNIHVVLGYVERYGGSLYIAQAIIDETGAMHASRRKLRTTHSERTVFGEGDGSDLKVHETSLGRLGALSCFEHLQSLAKYAMHSQQEQIHVAAWPAFCFDPEKVFVFGHEANMAVTRTYAIEGMFCAGSNSNFFKGNGRYSFRHR